jgi:anti-sigma factor RsiW
MTQDPIDDQDVHAFIDGELPAARMQAMAARIGADPALAARVAAYRADQQRLLDAFGPIASRPLPASWLRRIEDAPPERAAPRWLDWRAAAAVLLLGVGLSGAATLWLHRPDGIVQQASAARDGATRPARSLTGGTLPDGAERDALLQATLGLRVRAPDLSPMGYHLAAIDIFGGSSGRASVDLVYRDAQDKGLTVYLRKSPGEARFDMLRRGRTRICIWQDDVISVVMMGDVSGGEMMRLASKAYTEISF